MNRVLKKLMEGVDLKTDEAIMAFHSMIEGEMSDVLAGGLLVALSIRGERAEYLKMLAEIMLEKAKLIDPKTRPLLDIVGTGGDSYRTLNISTLSSLIVAGYGVKVAKHGNRAVSGFIGSADLIEALGMRIDAPPELTETAIEKVGFGFLFAPLYHPAMKSLAKIRKELGVRTVFNLLGPLINPALPEKLLIGAPTLEKARVMAQTLRLMGKSGAVIHGLEGIDEVSTQGKTALLEVSPDGIREQFVEPEDFGISPKPIETIKVSSREEAVSRARNILEGQDDPGLEGVLMEASIGLYLSHKIKFKEGIDVALNVLKEGKALEILEKAKEIVNNELYRENTQRKS